MSRAKGDDTQADSALNYLCQAYWQPIFCYIRRHIANPDQAPDLTQDYFRSLLRREYLKRADRNLGKLRSFLLADVKWFLRNATRPTANQPVVVSLDLDWAQRREMESLPVNCDGDTAYDLAWALLAVEKAKELLGRVYHRDGKGRVFDALSPWIGADAKHEDYIQIAATGGLPSPDAAKVALHRLRPRFRSALAEVLSETVSEPAETERELRYLLEVLIKNSRSSNCGAQL